MLRQFERFRYLLLPILLCVLLLAVGCGGGRIVKEGDVVAVHYHGTLDNGEVFDSSRGRVPLTFIVGSGQVISGFDKAVRGLSVGETVTVRLEPDEAYGQRREELILEVPRDQAPENVSVGDSVGLSSGGTAVVLEVTDEIVRIDANHQLVGKTLTFEIELVSIE